MNDLKEKAQKYVEYAESVNLLDGEVIRLCGMFQYLGQSKESLLLRINNFWQTLESHKEELIQGLMNKESND